MHPTTQRRKRSFSLILAFLFLCLSAQAGSSSVAANCTFNGYQLWGKIQVVKSFPDVEVQVVSSFPDLRVQEVDSFADSCGKWQLVDSFADTKVKFVDSFADVQIQYVGSAPGRP